MPSHECAALNRQWARSIRRARFCQDIRDALVVNRRLRAGDDAASCSVQLAIARIAFLSVLITFSRRYRVAQR